ncbi:MAG: acyl carrier protein [Planctomycetaceae bacterium]|nr:acyl carrier protein [Planctomycetaceae bacterium]
MDAQQFLAELDELFELDPGTLTPANVIQDIPGWSSLTFMGLIALVDEECGVTLAPDTILSCENLADLLNEVGISESTAQAA